MRIVKYPSCVNQQGIKINQNKKGTCRYSLEIPLIQNGKTNEDVVCVILKNPSQANKKHCDPTVSKVCNAAYNNGYTKVIILNLFPYYSTKVVGLKQFFSSPNYQTEMNKNQNEILKFCKITMDTVFAWGQISFQKKLYDSVIQNTITLVKGNTFYVRCSKCNHKSCNMSNHGNIRYPLHGQCWSNTAIFISY